MTTLSVLAGGCGDGGQIVALKLAVSAPSWRRNEEFGHHFDVVKPKVDAGCRYAKTFSFGMISKVSRRDAKSDEPYSGRGVSW